MRLALLLVLAGCTPTLRHALSEMAEPARSRTPVTLEDTLTALVLDRVLLQLTGSPPRAKVIVIELDSAAPVPSVPPLDSTEIYALHPAELQMVADRAGDFTAIRLRRPEVHGDSAGVWVGAHPVIQRRPGRSVMVGCDGCGWIIKRLGGKWHVIGPSNCLTC